MSKKITKEKIEKAEQYGKNVAKIRRSICNNNPIDCAESISKKDCDSHLINASPKERLHCQCQVEKELGVDDKFSCKILQKEEEKK